MSPAQRTRFCISLIVAAFIYSCVFLYSSLAYGATQSDIGKATAYIEKHTVESTTILADDDAAYFVRIYQMLFPKCGANVSMNISRLAIKNPWSEPASDATILTSVHISIGKGDGMRILMDLNADGAVDQVTPSDAGTRESTQPEFDRIVACITRLK